MDPIAELSIIPCAEILYRAILKKKDLAADGRAEVELFLLKHSEDGLSVQRKKSAPAADYLRKSFKKTYGAVSLHTGTIRDVGKITDYKLDVIEDEIEGREVPGHALIINLPHSINDFKSAERIATLLRDQCRKVVL